MIRPDFTVTQDESFVYINILVKYVKISKAEFYIEGNNFKFYLHPYLLDLCFPHNLTENDKAKAVYDAVTSTFQCKVAKEVAGEDFPNLNMMTSLLRPRPESDFPNMKHKGGPVIEVISSSENPGNDPRSEEEKKAPHDLELLPRPPT